MRKARLRKRLEQFLERLQEVTIKEMAERRRSLKGERQGKCLNSKRSHKVGGLSGYWGTYRAKHPENGPSLYEKGEKKKRRYNSRDTILKGRRGNLRI